MRKTLIVVIVLLAVMLTSCVTYHKASDVGQIQQIIEFTDEYTAGEVYDMTLAWFAEAFNNSNAVIRYKNREEGVIKGRYKSSFTRFIAEIYVEQYIMVEIKEGKVRFTISEPLDSYSANGMKNYDYSIGEIEQINTSRNIMIASYFTFLNDYKARSDW